VATGKARGPWVKEVFKQLDDLATPGCFLQVLGLPAERLLAQAALALLRFLQVRDTSRGCAPCWQLM